MSAPTPPLNYRHAFHAGNFADVLKHATLISVLAELRKKAAPLCYFDTHAGRGRYALGGAAARRTGEAAGGVLRLLGAAGLPAPLRAYVELVRALGEGDPGAYPGSPLIAASLLRAQDEAILCELEPGEATALRELLHADRRFHVHQRDGYEALGALLPPRAGRGLVLVDPPFEAREGEFARILAALGPAAACWPGGRFLLWYPIKERAPVRAFHRGLRELDAGPVLCAEFLVHPANTALRLNGCGVALVRPPWGIECRLDALLTGLVAHLAVPGSRPERHLEWLA